MIFYVNCQLFFLTLGKDSCFKVDVPSKFGVCTNNYYAHIRVYITCVLQHSTIHATHLYFRCFVAIIRLTWRKKYSNMMLVIGSFIEIKHWNLKSEIWNILSVPAIEPLCHILVPIVQPHRHIAKMDAMHIQLSNHAAAHLFQHGRQIKKYLLKRETDRPARKMEERRQMRRQNFVTVPFLAGRKNYTLVIF